MQVLSIRLFLISARENLLFCSDKVQSTVTTFLHFMEPLYCCVNNFPVLYTSLISFIKGRFIRLIYCNIQSVVHNIGMDFKLFCMLAHVLTFWLGKYTDQFIFSNLSNPLLFQCGIKKQRLAWGDSITKRVSPPHPGLILLSFQIYHQIQHTLHGILHGILHWYKQVMNIFIIFLYLINFILVLIYCDHIYSKCKTRCPMLAQIYTDRQLGIMLCVSNCDYAICSD